MIKQVFVSTNMSLGLKKNPMFRATRPYLSEPADPRLFFYKNAIFFRGGLYN